MLNNLILNFDNPDNAFEVKRIIDENKKTSKEIELTVLSKLLEYAENDIYYPVNNS